MDKMRKWNGINRKKTHKHGQRWAANYLMRTNQLNRKVNFKKLGELRTPLTDEQREAKQNTRRELSGKTKLVPVRCPRCNTGSRQFLEVEHVDNPQVLRIDNCFVKLCSNCGGE